MESFYARVISLERLGSVVILKLEPEREISFKAGQFFRLWGEVDGKTLFRPYSVASPPSYPYLEFAIHILEKGTFTKGYIDKLKVEDVVKVDGPFGHFTYEGGSAVFVAGGVGIAPIMSILREIGQRGGEGRYTLYYSAKTPAEAPYISEILSYGWLEKHITFTREQVRGFGFGRFNEESFQGAWDVGFVCGGKAFGEMVKKGLEGKVKTLKAELWG